MQLRYLLCYFVSLTIFSTTFSQGQLHNELLEGFESATTVEAIILFKQQERLHPIDTDALTNKAEKGRFVYEQISKTANNSQAAVKAYLDDAGLKYRSLKIANVISLRLTEVQARNLQQLANVDIIIPNPWVQQDLGFIEREQAAARQAIEWGVNQIGAPALWAQGFTGQGVTVGGQDTGYDYLHPTLIGKYRGTIQGSGEDQHDYNWHDAIHSISPLNNDDNNPCGLDVEFPCDDNNHGTHTMGTMVGDDGQGNQIGVAPGASWVACRNMERGWGSPASYLECFEWFLAPTRVDGSEPDPSQAPHVIANSWSCPEVEGCLPETFALFDIAINNLRAAGVVVVTSAGNDGSDCATISKPPSVFPGAYSIGATNDQDFIAGFSSRGPATYNGETYLQPQVVAPGVNIRSATRDGGYASFSGTSMAGPHTAGAVAVLISALPELAGNVEGIERILRESALPLISDQDCGDFSGADVPNAVYGYGRIDLESAYELGQELVNNHEVLLAEKAFLVAPNPASDFVTVQATTADLLATSYSITDLSGRTLRTFASNETPGFRLDIRDLASGVYLVQVKSNAGLGIYKIVKR